MTEPRMIHIETLEAPEDYPRGQITRAWAVASMIQMISPDDRGNFVLCELPSREA